MDWVGENDLGAVQTHAFGDIDLLDGLQARYPLDQVDNDCGAGLRLDQREGQREDHEGQRNADKPVEGLWRTDIGASDGVATEEFKGIGPGILDDPVGIVDGNADDGPEGVEEQQVVHRIDLAVAAREQPDRCRHDGEEQQEAQAVHRQRADIEADRDDHGRDIKQNDHGTLVGLGGCRSLLRHRAGHRGR